MTNSDTNSSDADNSEIVFASPSRLFYHDVTNPAHLSGLSHLDNFIVTRKSCPHTGTLQKRMPTLTQTATPYTTGPLAVRRSLQHPDCQRAIKSLAAHPCNRPFTAKHMLFVYAGLQRDNSCLSTGTLPP